MTNDMFVADLIRRSFAGRIVTAICLIFVLALIANCLIPVVGTIPVVGMLINPFGVGSPPIVIEAATAFETLTGWRLPEEATILENRNTHCGFKNDGDYTLVVQTTPAQLDRWMEVHANQWHDFPIAAEVKVRMRNLPTHDGRKYFAKKTFEADNDWHRGHIVIANSETGMIWIYHWKD